jgi:E3 ubiquitin-protein ligase CHFR
VFILKCELGTESQQKRKLSESEEEKKEREQKVKADLEKVKKMDEMGQHLECQICYDIMHQAVSVMPCVHNFCGGCFSDWMLR